MNKERLISYRKFCVKHKYSYCIPEDYKFAWDSTNKEGEKALQLLKSLLPSKRQTKYKNVNIKMKTKEYETTDRKIEEINWIFSQVRESLEKIREAQKELED